MGRSRLWLCEKLKIFLFGSVLFFHLVSRVVFCGFAPIITRVNHVFSFPFFDNVNFIFLYLFAILFNADSIF